MRGFWPLLKKEFREQWRTYRLLIVGSLFLMFGITTPLTLRYLPQILESAGEGITIEIPLPTAAQSLTEYAGTIAQAGVAAFVELNLLLGLFLVFCLAVTLMLSSRFKSSLAAGGIALSVLLGQALLGAAPYVGDFMPNKILGWGNSLLMGGGDSYWGALAVTVVAIGICTVGAQRSLKLRDL